MLFVDRTCGSGNLYVGEDTEGEIVELLFGIAAKIRLQPEILPVWFTKRVDTRERWPSNKPDDFVGVTSKEDFPLCYQLIDHVHHDGRIGDFSRTGLLYIFESASKSPELEQWIVESDLPTLMASGLGALYSQLSRYASVWTEDERTILINPKEAHNLTPAQGATYRFNTVRLHRIAATKGGREPVFIRFARPSRNISFLPDILAGRARALSLFGCPSDPT